MIANKPLLVTSSLLDSFAWYEDSPASWKEKAANDLSNNLNRVYTDLGPAIKRGMDFEASICKDMALPRVLFEGRHGEILSIFHDKCSGGRQQDVVKREIIIDDQRFLLYGKMDVCFAKGSPQFPNGKILDIKTTAKWKGHGYYTGRAQHPLYISASGIPEFEYVVAIGEDSGSSFIPDSVMCVDASLSTDDATAILENKIRAFVAFLAKNPKLQDAYVHVFTR